MPTSFFDLPRELRDYIYTESLVSPTGCVIPVIKKSIRHRRALKTPDIPRGSPSPSWRTSTCQLQLFPCDPSTVVAHVKLKRPSLPLATGLCLANRQTHQETAGLIWAHNTFLFPDGESAIQVLKYMGQVASTLIQRVQLQAHIRMRVDQYHELGRALSMLASRSRRDGGALREVMLCIVRTHRISLYMYQRETEPVNYITNGELLNVLERNSECTWSYGAQRVAREINMIRGNRREKVSDANPTTAELELRQEEFLHQAWGDRLRVNGKLVWERGRLVKDSVRSGSDPS